MKSPLERGSLSFRNLIVRGWGVSVMCDLSASFDSAQDDRFFTHPVSRLQRNPPLLIEGNKRTFLFIGITNLVCTPLPPGEITLEL
ncbi:MAG: hypothetical protein IH825_07600 [Candidatus Marinimicrobia bacterium]|nr:hypothetical protein [Candidatus Neomarinimicrobiota bacterium]